MTFEGMEINILGQKYKVVEVNHIAANEEKITIGDVDYATNEIIILKDLCKERKEREIWYEIIEIILAEQGHEKYNRNEDLINALATGIHNVFKDNYNLK